jgi:hypothetical protein
MPNIQKIVVSGSFISQLSNDAGYALATNISGAFTPASGGFSTRITTLEVNGPINAQSASLAQTASFVLSDNVKFTVVVSGTSSFETLTEVSTSIATNIATNTTNIGTLTDATASYALKTQVSGAFTPASGGFSTRITTLEEAVGSGGTLISSSVEGDAQGQIKFNGVNVDANNLGTGDSPQFTNLTLTGDLFVGGATTTINTANLNIEDKFILLNSGSSGTTSEGGIIVEASGSSGVGNAFYYDSFENRWSVAEGVNYDDTAVTAEAFMSVAIVDTLANAESSSYYQTGNIIIDGQDIYIVTV